jgi:threonine dehydrogenase-like Zn-dependent dehydrogenase
MRTLYAEKNIPRLLLVKALKPLWPGVIWSPLSHVRLLEIPDPPLPGPRWLRVKNRQCGIDGTDLSFLHLDVDLSVAPAALPGIRGFFLGHEVVGEVVETGPEVNRFKLGDRVVMESRPFATPNCFTQEISPPCPFCAEGQTRLCENGSLGLGPEGAGGGWGDSYLAHETELYPAPDDLNDDQACLIEPTSVALHAALQRKPKDGNRLLVIGAGSMGLLVTAAIKALTPDSHITVVARYPHQEQLAGQFGADEVIRESDSLYVELGQRTKGKYYSSPLNRGMLIGGFDQVYDCVGVGATITDGLRWTRARGTLVMVGTPFKPLKVDLSPVWYQEVDLIGTVLFGVERVEGREIRTFDLAVDLIRAGILRPQELITHRFPFENHRRAIATALDKHTGAIKVVLEY